MFSHLCDFLKLHKEYLFNSNILYPSCLCESSKNGCLLVTGVKKRTKKRLSESFPSLLKDPVVFPIKGPASETNVLPVNHQSLSKLLNQMKNLRVKLALPLLMNHLMILVISVTLHFTVGKLSKKKND